MENTKTLIFTGITIGSAILVKLLIDPKYVLYGYWLLSLILTNLLTKQYLKWRLMRNFRQTATKRS